MFKKEKAEHMTQRTYLQLPINADEGFPQSFRLSFNGTVYQVLLYVNVLEDGPATPDADGFYSLPTSGAFMVMRVLREDTEGTVTIFLRKLVSNLEYEAAELAFVFRQMQVARSNLNGIGSFGSQVIGGIATRWVS
jgi:hypothetical protein